MSDSSYTTFASPEDEELDRQRLAEAAAQAQATQAPVKETVPVEPEHVVAQATTPPGKFKLIAPKAIEDAPPPPGKFKLAPPPTEPESAYPYEKGGKIPPPDAGPRLARPITRDVIPNIVAGVIEGPLDTAGGYADIAKGYYKAIVPGEERPPLKTEREPSEPPKEAPKEEPTASKLKSYLPLNLDPRYVYPPDQFAKYARKGLSEASSAAAMYGTGLPLRFVPGPIGTAGRFLNAGGVLGNTAAGFAGGIGGEASADYLTPEGGDKDIYRTGGQIGGSLFPAAFSASKLGRLPGQLAHQFFDPLNVPGIRPKHLVPGTDIEATGKQLELAGRAAANELGGRGEIPGVVSKIDSSTSLVPGAEPTTSEVLEGKFGPFTNWARERFPGIFKASDEARNAARVEALPEYRGSDVGDFVERQRDRVDTIGSIGEDAARAKVVPAVRDIGGHNTQADYDAAIRTAAEARHTKAGESLDDQVAKTKGLAEKLGVIPDENSKLTSLQQYGQQLREGIVAQPRKGSVEEILAKDAEHLYDLKDSEVPKKMWNSGSTAAEDTQDVLKRSNKNFRRIMTDYVAFDFMDKVGVKDSLGRQTGAIDPGKYRTYMKQHADSFESYERATGDTSLRQRFSDVLSAQQEVTRLQGERAAIAKSFPHLMPGGPISGVADQFFVPGNPGAGRVAAFKQAFGGDPAMEERLFDYAMSKMRRQAVNPDGTLNAAEFDKFMKSHEKALNEFDPALTDKLKSVRSAQETLDQQSALRAKTVQDYESSSARYYLNNVDPKDSITKLLKSDSPASEMLDMVNKVRHDQPALNGLKRDFMDTAKPNWIEKVDGKDVLNFKKYDSFLTDHERPMRILLGDDAYNGLKTIAKDMENQQSAMARLSTAEKKDPTVTLRGGGVLGGHGGTALSAIGGAISGSVIAQAVFNSGADLWTPKGLIHAFHIAAGAASAAGVKHMISSMRAHGIDTVGDLIGEAAVNPQVLKFLLSKAPLDQAHPGWRKLGSILTNQALSNERPKYGQEPQPVWKVNTPPPPGVVIPMIPTAPPAVAPPMAR